VINLVMIEHYWRR